MTIRWRAKIKPVKKAVAAVVLLTVIFACVYAQKEQPFDEETTELEKRLQTASGEEKIDTLNRLADLYRPHSAKKSLEYCSEALHLSEQMNYQQGKAYALIYRALSRRELEENENPLESCETALKIFQKLKDKKGIQVSLKALAIFYRDNGNFDEALKYSLEALKVSEAIDDKYLTAESLYQVGRLYTRFEEYDKALEYFQRAYNTGKEIGETNRTVYYLNNIGIVYLMLKQYERALEISLEALKLFTENGDENGAIVALHNTGIIYGELGNYDQSFKYLYKGLERAEKAGGYTGTICRTFLQVGNNHFKMKNYKEAISSYSQALKKAREIDNTYFIHYIYKSLSEVYEASGGFKDALEYFKLYTELKFTLINDKKNKQIASLQEKYEADKRAKEIEILKKSAKIQKMTRNYLALGIIIILIFSGFLVKRYMYLFAFWKKQKYIGSYRLVETIGSGGMGHVFKARNIRNNSAIVAIKVLKEELSQIESNRKRFKQEGTIIDKLNHPNILKIIERGVHENKLYFVMEFIEGKTLETIIREKGQLDLHRCLHIMIQVTDALALIHSRNIVHRDLKPANIMLTQENGDPDVVKLLDFGLSQMKHQTRLTESGYLVGTVNYLAPEQIIDLDHSPASDIYSLGIIFYEMIIGKMAFDGNSLPLIVEQILDSPPPPPNRIRPEISDQLNNLILQMILKQNTKRPSARHVLEILKELSLSNPYPTAS